MLGDESLLIAFAAAAMAALCGAADASPAKPAPAATQTAAAKAPAKSPKRGWKRPLLFALLPVAHGADNESQSAYQALDRFGHLAMRVAENQRAP